MIKQITRSIIVTYVGYKVGLCVLNKIANKIAEHKKRKGTIYTTFVEEA